MKIYFFLLLLLQFVVSCAPLTKQQNQNELLAYIPQPAERNLLSDFQPVFLIEKPNKLYNRIGTPKAETLGNGEEKIYVDVHEATVFTEVRKFKTVNDTYSNLIYRVHFPETPYSIFPFQIGAGKNVGIIVIVTLNSTGQPVLYTTVHTCGCYLAIIPTTYLPTNAYPPDWPEKKQVVYTEILPAIINPKDTTINRPILTVLVRDASHRIRDVWLSDDSELKGYPNKPARLAPLSSLEKLPLNGSGHTTSFYETSADRIGYVKGSRKLLERLLMSWWTLDWNIGEDKKFSADTLSPPIFFTSLKPWARNESDLRDFRTFLTYWGWRL